MLGGGSRATRLGEEVDANRGLVHVVERVVHEACDQGRLADCIAQDDRELVIVRGFATRGGVPWRNSRESEVAGLPLCSPKKTSLRQESY